MSEPVTTNKTLIVPNTGDLVAAWGTAALNPNFQLVDAMLGGVTSISLSSATTLLLTVPNTTGIWLGSVPQHSNSMITFTGAQTGNAIIQFQLPGFYIINNQCTGTSYVQLSPFTGGGNSIGVAQGKKTHVFFDGTNLDFVNTPDPGAALDLHGWTALPPWMNACTVKPYLIKDGSSYSTATYPALFAALGTTFGGSGSSFNVPDERARGRIGLDTVQAASGATSARITFGVNGMTGSLMGSAGGTAALVLVTANLPPYTPAGNISGSIQQENSGAAGPNSPSVQSWPATNPVTPIFTGTPQGGVSQAVNNVGPAIISFLPLIKT